MHAFAIPVLAVALILPVFSLPLELSGSDLSRSASGSDGKLVPFLHSENFNNVPGNSEARMQACGNRSRRGNVQCGIKIEEPNVKEEAARFSSLYRPYAEDWLLMSRELVLVQSKLEEKHDPELSNLLVVFDTFLNQARSTLMEGEPPVMPTWDLTGDPPEDFSNLIDDIEMFPLGDLEHSLEDPYVKNLRDALNMQMERLKLSVPQ